MNRRYSLFVVAAAVVFFIAGFVFLNDDHGSKTITSGDNNQVQTQNPVPSFTPPIYTDNLDGANDTTALKSRGYKVWYRGTGPQGTTATWFQGNSTVFPAFNGPATGYVAANYNAVTGTNTINSWLVLPYMSGGLMTGDSLYFYSRSPTASTYPDSIRVMVSASDSVPEGTWVELGRFKVNTAGMWERRGFRSSVSGSHARFAIRYNVVNGGPSGTNSDFIGIDAIQIVRSGPSILYNVPELIYYRFENNLSGPLRTPNFASAPVGTNPAPIIGHTVMSGGQFDSCMNGTGGSGSTSALTTGWNCNLGSTQWTMSFWVSNLVDLNPTYLFGDPGSTSFRCFYGGAALPNNMLLRGPMTDILIPCPMPGNQVFHIVYNGTNVIVYRNGVLVSTNPRSINMPTGSGFKVGGYSTTSFSMSGKMDEFRLYNRALTPTEITATWNQELPILVGTPSNNNQVPNAYNLSQNYPNPFNPATKISFSLPKAGDVKLVVYDILGKEVAIVINDFRTAGTHTIDFNASNLASGVYLYRIEAGTFTDTKKMMLLK
jgi:hypothetical protein